MKRSISPPTLFPPSKLSRFKDPFPETLKIISWNCDGLTQYLSALGMDLYLKKKGKSFLSRFIGVHRPDILCLQEIHIRESERPDLVRKLNVDVPGYKSHVVLPSSSAGRRRSGVCTLYRSDLKPTTKTVDWDSEGRVSILSLPGLSVINTYCLNSSDHPYIDPVTRIPHGTRGDRKRQFDSLLSGMIREMSQNVEVVALGDFNVSRHPIDTLGGSLRIHYPHAKNRSHFNTCYSCLRDVIRERYPTDEKYSWFSRNGGDRSRVDLILATDGIEVVDANTLEDADRGESDHCPIMIEMRQSIHM